MDSSSKRKNPPGGGSQGHPKKNKGNGNKWQTPQHKAKLEARSTLEVGDVGFWATCQRNKEVRALGELMSICEEYGEKLYGINADGVNQGSGEDDDGDDIEASIQKEMDSLQAAKSKSARAEAPFDPVRLNLDCLLFVKTKAPVQPREVVRRICEDARLVKEKEQRKSRFLNRLTPITGMGRATEQGVEEVARQVLPEFFQLAGGEGSEDGPEKDGRPTYAIRYSSRAHNTLKRNDVINKVAALIGPHYKVDLTSPDKVILIEVYQTFIGMSVVDGEWEALKRYNIRELYESATPKAEEEEKEEAGKGSKEADEKEKDAGDATEDAKAGDGSKEPEKPQEPTKEVTE